ncbi:MAG: HAMP domain-containing protein [Proteobacteria bacterium]|nr:HAMP domain-containing protein [Pseudomonadota bacterium]MYJ96044.1 HAMP domain-containing protein [Pseudomonadota bacterium]
MKNWLQAIYRIRSRISTQLYLTIGGAVVLTVSASLVGWFLLNRVGEVQQAVNEGSVPELAAAFGVAQYSSALVAAAPRLAAAATQDDFREVMVDISASHAAFEEQLAVLEVMEAGQAPFNRIRAHSDTLISNITALRDEVAASFELMQRREALRLELEELRVRLDGIMIPAIDDQLFYTMTGYRDLGIPPEPRPEHFSENEFGRYRYLAELQADATLSTQLLASAFTLTEASLVEPLRERFEAVASRIERNLSDLQASPLHDELAPVFARLIDLGLGQASGFNLLVLELQLGERQLELLEGNQAIAIDLVAEVDGLVNTAQTNTEDATMASENAILTGRNLLLAISAVSVGSALLIAWLFVGRVLLFRLEQLSRWMRRMAGGDLETTVDIGGNDEVADMAAALEVFRRHALEVQRLNLVEKLADELKGKNEQLESVLEDLRQAQDQIVMREKLAALGELTAGVAHEIKNPLNFVKNFSEVSEELIDELKEALEDVAEQIPEDDRSYIDEITGDLTGNLQRIQSHGERANRIVHDMLQMGRGSGDLQPTDINGLLDEYARLAYHSARASDSEFQLDILRDLDPEMGDVDVIPQDLGRVFLNMVGNACYATDEKRKAGEVDGYEPTISLKTRRGEENIEIHIRDNGSGMPPHVVEKIFNPFFTTKPTGEGTGLGLAMSSDIVREHGGTIQVETEPGEFTEMIIELPLEPPLKQAEEGA